MPIKAKEEKKSIPQLEKDTTDDSVEECIKGLSSLAIDSHLVEYSVNFVMREDIRRIELKNIVDKRLENLDPKPDIQILFKEYDKRFFSGFLSYFDVEICWSDLLKTNIGVHYNENEERPVVIRLSRKHLRDVKRRHLVETLLHQMIHAYCFVRNFKDKAPHGIHFKRIMTKVNDKSGANITTAHNLIDDNKDEE